MDIAVADPVVVIRQHEVKCILSAAQREYLIDRLRGNLQADAFGRTSILTLYYDTPDCLLIRNSVEKPEFKEKIRLRSYGLATQNSPVFLEIKRKLAGTAYKRRVQTTVPQADAFFRGEDDLGEATQIKRELCYFRDYYRSLCPSCLIVYERTAYAEPGGDLRLTIDEAPRFRAAELDLTSSAQGRLLLPEGFSILEIKVQQAIPVWLTEILSKGKIYPCGFSKYGAAYRRFANDNCPERMLMYV